MKIALIVNRVTKNKEENFQRIIDLSNQAAQEEAKFLLFPETAITGLINNDDPNHDILLGEEIPGEVTDKLSSLANNLSIYLGIGLFEREENSLYDSTILIDPNGEIILKHRKEHPEHKCPECVSKAIKIPTSMKKQIMPNSLKITFDNLGDKPTNE